MSIFNNSWKKNKKKKQKFTGQNIFRTAQNIVITILHYLLKNNYYFFIPYLKKDFKKRI